MEKKSNILQRFGTGLKKFVKKHELISFLSPLVIGEVIGGAAGYLFGNGPEDTIMGANLGGAAGYGLVLLHKMVPGMKESLKISKELEDRTNNLS